MNWLKKIPFPKFSFKFDKISDLAKLPLSALGKIETVCEVAFIYIKHRKEIKEKLAQAIEQFQLSFRQAIRLFSAPLRLVADVLNIFGDLMKVATETEQDEKWLYEKRDKIKALADKADAQALEAQDKERLNMLSESVKPH